MSLLEQVVLAWQCLLYTVRQMGRLSLWAPWALLGAFQLALVACLWWFAHPALSWFMAPLLRWASGGQDTVLHYPEIFSAMPLLFTRADLVVGLTLGAIVAGGSTALFATQFAGRPTGAGQGLGTALRRGGALILVNLPLTVLVITLSLVLHAWGAGHGGVTARVARVGGILGAVVLQALFLYVTPLVMVGGRSALGALAEIPRVAGRGLWAALVLTALAALVLFPFHSLTSSANAIVARGRPELVGWALMLQIGTTLLVGFMLTGSSTLVYQSVIARRDDA